MKRKTWIFKRKAPIRCAYSGGVLKELLREGKAATTLRLRLVHCTPATRCACGPRVACYDPKTYSDLACLPEGVRLQEVMFFLGYSRARPSLW